MHYFSDSGLFFAMIVNNNECCFSLLKQSNSSRLHHDLMNEPFSMSLFSRAVRIQVWVYRQASVFHRFNLLRQPTAKSFCPVFAPALMRECCSMNYDPATRATSSIYNTINGTTRFGTWRHWLSICSIVDAGCKVFPEGFRNRVTLFV
jgi:hypothetical protein